MLIKQINQPEFMIELRHNDEWYEVKWRHPSRGIHGIYGFFNLDAALTTFEEALRSMEGQ